MSKKILVFDEDEDIKMAIRGCLVGDEPLMNKFDCILSNLKDHELDVIEFKAEVSGIHYSIRTAKTLSQHIELKTHPEIKDIKSRDKLQVFLVKPKKPEL